MTDAKRAKLLAGDDADLEARILVALERVRDEEREKCQLLISLMEWDVSDFEEWADFDPATDWLQ